MRFWDHPRYANCANLGDKNIQDRKVLIFNLVLVKITLNCFLNNLTEKEKTKYSVKTLKYSHHPLASVNLHPTSVMTPICHYEN